jgi:5-hydroxyisourate hydrolase
VSLSTHVLDSVTGTPAAGIAVLVEFRAANMWQAEGAGTTDADGRVQQLPTPRDGVYRLTFATGPYHAARGVSTFYPEVCVVFTVTDPSEHHHVPLLLSPFAYSTYRGS